MRAYHLPIGLMAALLCGGSVQQPNATEGQPVNWTAATRDDVNAAYDIFSRHHPGMFDPHNAGFPIQLRHARVVALRFAYRAKDAEGHMRALALFSGVLADGHARVQASYSAHGDVLWPGFRTAWRGHGLYVLGPTEDGPPQKSELLACDGKDARTVVRESVASLFGRLTEQGQWWQFAPMAFERVSSPYEHLPRRCKFREPDGGVKGYALKWRPVPSTLLQARFAAESKRDPIAVSNPRPGIYLVTLDSFSPDNEGRAQYDRLFRDLDQNIASIAAARAVVIDLRQNHGGNSFWGERVADKLWGTAAVSAKLHRYFRNTKVWWLADAANIEHFRQLAIEFRAQGLSEDATEFDDVVRHLSAAHKEGKRFYVEDFGASFKTGKNIHEPRRLPPTYVITDGGCASACLDAVDVFARFRGVKLVGAPTSADSNYLDIRTESLPSGRGIIIMPTKIWVNRPRQAGQVYQPDIPVNDLDWSTSNILDHIEKDLTHWRPPTTHSSPSAFRCPTAVPPCDHRASAL